MKMQAGNLSKVGVFRWCVRMMPAVLFFICFCAVGGESSSIIKDSFLNLRDDGSEAEKNNRLLIVLFEQEGCPYCEQLHNIHFKHAVVRDLLSRHFDIVQLDIWGSRDLTDFHGQVLSEKRFAREQRVQFSPTLVVYEGTGREIYRIWGLHKPEVFANELDYLQSGAYKKGDFQTFQKAIAPTHVEAANVVHENFSTRNRDLSVAAKNTWSKDSLLLIFFEKKDCANCQELRQRHFTHEPTRKLLARHFTVVSLDIEDVTSVIDLDGVARTPQKIMDRMQVQLLPTMVFFDRSGKEIIRYEGHLTAEHLASGLLTYLSTHAYRQTPSLQDWLRDQSVERRIANQKPDA